MAYLLAIGVALVWLIWGPGTGELWADTLVADVLGTLVIFGFSRAHHNSSFYDAYWSVVPPLLMIYWWWSGDFRDAGTGAWIRYVLVATVIVVWAIRLTVNWLRSFPGLHHEDWRYPLLRERAGRAEFWADLVGIHLFPTLQVFLAMMPVYVAVTRSDDGIGWLAWVAFVIGMAAIVTESVADRQLRAFRASARPGEAITAGLWGWSRHPNYFGEFGFWVSLAIFGVSAAPGDAWWMFAGALLMLAMFLGASIPMMEERSLERRPEYRHVIDQVSKFVPLPPRVRA